MIINSVTGRRKLVECKCLDFYMHGMKAWLDSGQSLISYIALNDHFAGSGDIQMKTYNKVFAQLEYFNNHNVLVYYRNNLTRDDFTKANDELYILMDKQEFRGLVTEIELLVHSRRLKDIFDDKLPSGISIKGGLNGFGIVIVVAEDNVFKPHYSRMGKIETRISFRGSLEDIPWNDALTEKTYLKSYRVNSASVTSIPSAFSAGSWRAK